MAKKSTKKHPKTNALLRPVHVDAALAKIVGSSHASRAQIAKKVFGYAKKHKLLDRKIGNIVHPDATLAKVVGGAKLTTFQMVKKYNRHIG